MATLEEKVDALFQFPEKQVYKSKNAKYNRLAKTRVTGVPNTSLKTLVCGVNERNTDFLVTIVMVFLLTSFKNLHIFFGCHSREKTPFYQVNTFSLYSSLFLVLYCFVCKKILQGKNCMSITLMIPFISSDIQARGKDQSDFIKRKFCSYQ